MSRAKSAFTSAPDKRLALAGVLALSTLAPLAPLSTALAADEDVHACLSNYVETQKARRDGRLRAARAAVNQCGLPTCPDVIRNDCVRWQGELDQAIPTVVLSAIDRNGRDVTDVQVLVDGAQLVSRLDGRAVEMDPGAHVFRFVARDGTWMEQRVLVAEGERDRSVVGSFASPGGGERPDQAESPSRPVPASVWAFGGIGAGAAVTAVTFWSLAVFATPGLLSELSCKPSCPSQNRDAMTVRAEVGDVAGAVALLTLGTAVYLLLTRPPAARAVGFDPGSATAGWGFAF